MIAFKKIIIEDHCSSFGVEPICKVLPIASPTYYKRAAFTRHPERASNSTKSDAALRLEINRFYDENRQVYGAGNAWHTLRRQGHDITRCTVERLMRTPRLQGGL
ncbi:hypothetical protein FHS77_003176 [Paenochrobactrum gallinarii]|uniref:HTH-like domain-containing protein n=1 Tax=Paenochrobactrum gallinarii TaxID=643673 RepID=A0A841LYV6_9HYPH|nr:IS3 family transposase [Paenochrobactrum gallinarii]MBB6262596.1 hypothetical protein [Paenochrobactrum gallinarii]